MPLEEEEELTEVSWSGKWMVTVFPDSLELGLSWRSPHLVCLEGVAW